MKKRLALILIRCKCGTSVFCDVEDGYKDGDRIDHSECLLKEQEDG